jgi:hypothetical protein
MTGGEQYCPICDRWKPTQDFPKGKIYSKRCKTCYNAYRRERYQRNPRLREQAQARARRSRERGQS